MINWFPGHMTKSLRKMQSESKLCNLFIYVLDARAPFSCLNPEFVKFIGDKPICYVLNKSDLANSQKTNEWKKYLTKTNSSCVAFSPNMQANHIISEVNKLLQPLIQKNKENNVKFIFRCMVIGVPNCGKSTIVNKLCGKARAITGDKPGVTRSTQWVNVSEYLQVMDTPGTLWPSFKDERTGYKLAYIGSIKDEVVGIEHLALKFVSDMKNKFKNIFSIYNIDIEDKTDLEILEQIARKRGCVLRGNEIDYERISLMLIKDFRKGALGRYTLDDGPQNE